MMTRGCIALFCQVLLASAIANEMPCTEDSSTCTPSEAGSGDDTNILLQRKVDTHEQRIGEEEQSSHGWVVTPSLFSDSMTMTARVKIGGAFQTEGTLTAFGPLVGDDVETQIRGVQSNPGTSPFPGVGTIYQITMYANAGGELLTFRFKDIAGKVTTLKPTETFVVNADLGNAITPIDLEADGDAWDVNPAAFSDTMTMTAQSKIDGVVAKEQEAHLKDGIWPYQYKQIFFGADCCRNNGAEVGSVRNGDAPTPQHCESHCTANPDCWYFSHSMHWQNCALCSHCDEIWTGNSAYYNSWLKLWQD